MAQNFNKCIEYARGEYIKFLCVDDILLPDCLESMVAKLDEHPDVSLVCAGRLSINASGQRIGTRSYSPKSEIVEGSKVISECLIWGNLIGEPSAVMFRKSEAVRAFREDLPQLMDLEMWFRLLENRYLLNIAVPLCSIRIHADQMTGKNLKSSNIVDDNILIFNEFKNKPYLKLSIWSLFQHRLLMSYRVWLSRDFLLIDIRKDILRKYGNYFVYLIMPIFIIFIHSKFIKKILSK